MLKKWLGYREAKRRDGRPLTLEEAAQLRDLVQHIAALLALHDDLDAAYRLALDGCFSADELGLRGTRP